MRKYFFLSVIGFCTGCYYDNMEELHPNFATVCDTTSVTISYNTDIIPILTSGCGISDNACHNTDNSASNIGLETYAGVMTQVTPDNLFLKSIVHDPVTSAMPKGGGKLDECSIMKIESWINHGYLNN
ncbi:hypothetical protein BH11BAC1_BH11BAC1_17530 [soil metagenome]